MIYLDSMGHLYSTESVQELYDFAVKKLNLKPEWNHYSRHFPHFDLTTQRMQKRALSLGAKWIDAREDKDQVEKVRVYSKSMLKEEYSEKGNKYFYESKGLYGQKILRIDFSKLGIK